MGNPGAGNQLAAIAMETYYKPFLYVISKIL